MTATLSRSYLSRPVLRKLAYWLLLTLPVIAFTYKFSIVYRHGIFRGEDWDYFAQSYEAARLSILHYHQFPWWNPWMNGGQPLFANPQFGLFSIQMPLVLLFGTIAGLHYSILVYFVLGFWGIYKLLQRLGSKSKLITALLSYIWLFSSFAAWHLGGGQFTFVIYLLSPWAFLTILNIRRRRGWLWFGLVASLMIQTASHYLTIEALIICGIIAAIQIIGRLYRQHARTIKAVMPVLRPYALAGLLIVILCGVRLFYTFQFTHEYPRLEPLDMPESLKLFIASVTFRHPVNPSALAVGTNGAVPYGWGEYADYFGLITIALFCYLVIRRLENLKSISFKEWAILIATALAAAITVGAVTRFSPYSLLHHLPLFNQMRVPSRFICWAVLGVILFLARLPRKPVIYVLLAISVADVFAASYPILNYSEQPYVQAANSSRQFQQYEFFQTNPSLGQLGIMNIQNLRLLRATQSNYGEVYGYEPILNVGEYYYLPGTTRCGVKQGCGFVLSGNAIVTKWSPLGINLERTGSGPIKLNMNPGKVWYANGHALAPNYKILELRKDFVINDPAQKINVSFSPVL